MSYRCANPKCRMPWSKKDQKYCPMCNTRGDFIDDFLVSSKSNIITIDRSKPFDPTTFLGANCNIFEEDSRSLALTEIDLNEIRLVNMLRNGENDISGAENIRRSKEADYISLDAKVFQILWENQHLIPEKWKEKSGNYGSFVFFDGTIIMDLYRKKHTLCIY